MKSIVILTIITLLCSISISFADMIKMENGGDIWIYTDQGYKKKQLLCASNKNNVDFAVSNGNIYVKTKEGTVRVFSPECRLVKSYYAPNNQQANWVK